MTKDKLIELAQVGMGIHSPNQPEYIVCEALIEVLTQPEQKPIGLIESLKDAKPCCGEYETCWRACTPRGKFLGQRDAQRTWVGLTDEEREEIALEVPMDAVLITEAKLKEKNT